MSYTVHQAKTNLSKLLKQAEAGQEVIITRGKEPVAKLIALNPLQRIPGSMKGQLRSAADAFDPLTDEELRELGFE
jgi:prevent-host-death family protein